MQISLPYKHIIFILFYCVCNTILSLGILYIINSAVNNKNLESINVNLIPFFTFVVFSYLLNIFFQKRIVGYIYSIIYDNEFLLAKKIQNMSLKQFETFGTERIYGIMEDLRGLVFLPGVLTGTLNSLLMILLCLGYLFFESIAGGVLIVFLIMLIAIIYFSASKYLSKIALNLKRKNDIFNKILNDVILGFKELKISEIRKKNLSEKYIYPNRNESKIMHIMLGVAFNAITILSQYGLYIILGVIIFVFPYFSFLDTRMTSSYIVILLFLTGPINRVIAMQNFYVTFSVSYKRIKNFFKEIETNNASNDIITGLKIEEFRKLEFKDIEFQHDSLFKLGPINFSIRRGETLFIIGGNGSGKSTFINILTGLYSPSIGEILLNEKKISNSDHNYQNLLSAIFTNNHIFSNNYDCYSLKSNPRYIELLSLFQLDSVVKDDNEDSARRQLSKGQSKRMSMIFALLEDHPILILDEWAADQDPYFRKYFYESLLPVLKEQGKTIIAVTHDDSYFQHADRIVKFEYGCITKDIYVKKETFIPSVLWDK